MKKERLSEQHAPLAHGEAAGRVKLIWIVLGIIVLMLAYGLYVAFFVKEDRGLRDIFRILNEQGYTANVGLSGIFRPGNVIQVMEGGPDRPERQLLSPLLFLWGSDCFPDAELRESYFALPEYAGASSASLSLEPSMLVRLLPKLRVESRAVADYSLKLENTRVQTIARADLSGRFSEKCVEALRQTLDDGDKIAWFAVVVEAVVSDSLAFEVRWKIDSSAEARAAFKNELQQSLASVGGEHGRSGGLEVNLAADDEKKTVISAKGLVVIGYRARPMEPQYEEYPLRQSMERVSPESNRYAQRRQWGAVCKASWC